MQKVPSGLLPNFLGQIQGGCDWNGVWKGRAKGNFCKKFPLDSFQSFWGKYRGDVIGIGFGKDFFVGLRKRGSVSDRGMFTERGRPCGSRVISLHGSSAPIFECGRGRRDPAAGNTHVSSADKGDKVEICGQGDVFGLRFPSSIAPRPPRPCRRKHPRFLGG